jgi:capsular exopolysaccharide synthesis family protein
MTPAPAPSPSTPADRPRYTSLDDYVQVIRRRRWIVVVATLIGLALGAYLAISAGEDWTASASLSYRDASEDLALFGVDTTPTVAPSIRAAINAESITRPAVVDRVEKQFKGELSETELEEAVSARVGSQTQLVEIEATEATADLAARIANAFAETEEKLAGKETDERLEAIEKSIEDQLENLDIKDLRERPGTAAKIATLEQQLSRAKTLRDIAEPVVITQRAVPPDDPNNVSTAFGGIMGALFGLVFGLIGAFGRDALDRRVRSAHEVHAELGFPVVGRVPEGALGYAGLAPTQGRKQPMAEADFESFRVLRANLGFMADGGQPRVVLVTGPQAEDGKTTVSMSLASAAAMSGAQVLLVEADLRRPVFAQRLNVRPVPGLTDYLRGRAEPTEIVQRVELQPPGAATGEAAGAGTPFACITAGTLGSDAAELLTSAKFSGFIAEVREAFDMIVIDSSPLLAVVDPLELVEQSDCVLLCVRAHRTRRDDLRATRSALANLPDRPCGVVVTGLRRGGPDAYPYYYGY